jgi:hypothetical protein
MNDSDRQFLRSFENGTLPFAEWHHRAHLKVAYLYLRELAFDEALARARTNIQRYNAATNTPETLERGYHETMTVAWMRLVEFTLSEYGPAASADEFLAAQEHLANRKALRFFYSRDRLRSWQAKGDFVEPDITPLPRSTRTLDEGLRLGDSAPAVGEPGRSSHSLQ